MNSKKSTVFIDTNVWFSAFYKEGTCSQILCLLSNSLSWKIVISEQVLEEIIRTIQAKLPSLLPFITEYLQQQNLIIVKNSPSINILEYQDCVSLHDLPLLVSAIEYKCVYFITGNIKDFKIKYIKKKFKLQILSPSDFLTLLKKKK